MCIIDDDEAQYSESEATTVAYSVRVMIVNPDKMDYVMVRADMSPAEGFDEIKNIILASFPANIPQPHGDQVEFGYIAPSHGLKARRNGYWMIMMQRNSWQVSTASIPLVLAGAFNYQTHYHLSG